MGTHLSLKRKQIMNIAESKVNVVNEAGIAEEKVSS
jgi:hypothetical protein